MRDARAHGPHPSPDDVQAYVDEALDPARRAAVDEHVASCEPCGADVARLRRVTAALSLATAPPPDLLERIQARRRAGEHVILPVGDDAPPTPGAEERRVDALLSLASRPPDDLFERIQARRAAGQRVLLPPVPPGPARADDVPDDVPDVVVDHAAARTVDTADTRGALRWRRAWRWAVGPGVAAAVTLLGVRAFQSPAPRVAVDVPPPAGPPAAPSVAPSISSSPSTAPARQPAPSPARPLVVASAGRAPDEDRLRSGRLLPDSAPARADSAPAAAAAPHPPVTPDRETADELSFGIADDGAELDPSQRDRVDRAARLVREDATRRVLIRYTVRSAALAERVELRLRAGDVAPEQIRRRRVGRLQLGLPPGVEAVEIVIQRARGDDR